MGDVVARARARGGKAEEASRMTLTARLDRLERRTRIPGDVRAAWWDGIAAAQAEGDGRAPAPRVREHVAAAWWEGMVEEASRDDADPADDLHGRRIAL